MYDRNAYMREWKRKNPDKVSAINRAVKAKNPELYRAINRRSAAKMAQIEGHPLHKGSHAADRASDPSLYLLHHVRARARAKGIVCDLTVADVRIPEFCPVLGIKLAFGKGRKASANHSSPSVDRVIPSMGYVRGNVRVISNRANHLKNNATPEELTLIAEYARRQTALMRWRGLA